VVKLKNFAMHRVCEILNKNGFEAYVVGGTVRDKLLFKSESSDIDIATNATPQQLKQLFKSLKMKVIPIGEKFGTIQVMFQVVISGTVEYEYKIEVTTYRSEGTYSDKRHPDKVTFETELIKDLERRDFTVNAIALNPVTDELVDPFNGKQDLTNKIVRAVGNPEERFREDPLRMLRMCRFAGKLGFTVDPETLQATQKLCELILDVPMERVKEELFKILELKKFHVAWKVFKESKLLETLLPELAKLEGVEQPIEYHKYHVLTHSFLTANKLPRNLPLLRFAGLLHDVGKTKMDPTSPYFPKHEGVGTEIVEKIAGRLKFSTVEKKYLMFMVARHMDIFHYQDMKTKDMRRYLSKINIDNIQWIPDLIDLIKADINAQGYYEPDMYELVDHFNKLFIKVLMEEQPFTKKDLKINGYDFIELGLTPSPLFGKIFKVLVEEVVNDPTKNNRKYLLKRADQLKTEILK